LIKAFFVACRAALRYDYSGKYLREVCNPSLLTRTETERGRGASGACVGLIEKFFYSTAPKGVWGAIGKPTNQNHDL
jgi:hypothetical protein